MVNAANPLVLAVAAKDPDHSVDISGRPIPFQYVWSCAQTLPDAAAAALFENDAANNYGQQLVIPGGVLPDGVYTFTVQVSYSNFLMCRQNSRPKRLIMIDLTIFSVRTWRSTSSFKECVSKNDPLQKLHSSRSPS